MILEKGNLKVLMIKEKCKHKKLHKIILEFLSFYILDCSDGLGSQLPDTVEVVSLKVISRAQRGNN